MPMECALFYSDGIEGGNTKKGREGSSAVIEVEHEVYRPFDHQSQSAKGPRIHSAMTLITEMDKAVPPLYKYCCEGKEAKKLKELVLKWYNADDELYFTQTLTNAMIAAVEVQMPNTKEPDNEQAGHLVRLRLQYEKILWDCGDGIKHSDSWQDI